VSTKSEQQNTYPKNFLNFGLLMKTEIKFKFNWQMKWKSCS